MPLHSPMLTITNWTFFKDFLVFWSSEISTQVTSALKNVNFKYKCTLSVLFEFVQRTSVHLKTGYTVHSQCTVYRTSPY